MVAVAEVRSGWRGWLDRPLPAAMLVGLVSQLLFAWRVTTPHTLFFDEIHYVPAARTLWALEGPANTEHPLLGKLIIGLGMAIAGDGPLGWRLFSTIAGTAVVLGVFAILWRGLGRVRPAQFGAATAVLGFTVHVQARIAMLDGFMAAFVVWAAAAMLWSMRSKRPWRGWIAAAVLLGLATATKWTAAPYVAFAAIAFVILGWKRAGRWRGMSRIGAVSVLGVVSIGTYFASFAPAFFYAREPLTLAGLIPFQWHIYGQQTQVLPHHNYQSDWWSWPLLIRPIWYLYEPVDGAQRGVLLVGNPAVMWGGLVAVALCLWGWARDRSTACGVAAWTWIAGYGVWGAIPKSLGFFYYYYLPSIWLAVVLAVAFDHWRRRTEGWDEAFLVLAAVLFIHFHPILSASALDGPQAFGRWMWLRTWP